MSLDDFQSAYSEAEPARTEVNALRGAAVLEFGAPWCPICQGAQANIKSAIGEHSKIQHIKIEDGSGRPLGRSFHIKLWPTLVVLKDGVEVGRVVRPTSTTAIRDILSTSV